MPKSGYSSVTIPQPVYAELVERERVRNNGVGASR